MMQSRTHTCGELRLANAGQTVTLAGFMENVRFVSGSLAFVVLRDFYGTTQLLVEDAALLAQIKGYACAEEERVYGMCCVAVPIRDYTN